MNKKNDRIKHLISAHGWLGVIMSPLLFLIFWAGAISLFLDEVQQWAELPHSPVNIQLEDMSINRVIESTLAQYPTRDDKPVFVSMPNDRKPYYRFLFKTVEAEEGKELRVNIHVNPKTGEVVGNSNQFNMASYIYHLHYDLGLSKPGRYFIGFITLFLFFAVVSGIFIQAKKMVRNFFTYRTNKKRTQMLDIHNVVGVISLPFTLMYAITGLIFNLAIVYQGAIVVFLYQGDQDALLKDIGGAAVPYVAAQASGIKQDMVSLDSLVLETEKKYGPINFFRINNYTDSQASVEFNGKAHDQFVQRYRIVYQASDGKVIQQSDIEKNNPLINGLNVRTTLHYADFAHVDLRILYFFLAMAVTAMIVVGNLLWVNKRTSQKNTSSRVNHFVSKSTIGACTGFIVATAVIFLAERAMPIDIVNRSSLVIYLFWAAFLIVNLLVFCVDNIKRFIAVALLAMAVIIVTTVSLDWILFAPQLKLLWQSGTTSVMSVEIGLLIVALIGGVISFALFKRTTALEESV